MITPAAIFQVIAFMTFRTGRGMQGLRVAITAGRASMIDATAALPTETRMRTKIESKPSDRRMALSTICTEHIGVKNRIVMTTNTIS